MAKFQFSFRQFAAGYRCDRSSRTRSTREQRIINKLIKFFPSDLGLFRCRGHCASQYKHRPKGGEDDYSESNQLRQIVGLRSVGVSIGDETADAYRRGCCIFHGFNAPFMRSPKLTTICTRALRLKSNAVVTIRGRRSPVRGQRGEAEEGRVGVLMRSWELGARHGESVRTADREQAVEMPKHE